MTNFERSVICKEIERRIKDHNESMYLDPDD